MHTLYICIYIYIRAAEVEEEARGLVGRGLLLGHTCLGLAWALLDLLVLTWAVSGWFVLTHLDSPGHSCVLFGDASTYWAYWYWRGSIYIYMHIYIYIYIIDVVSPQELLWHRFFVDCPASLHMLACVTTLITSQTCRPTLAFVHTHAHKHTQTHTHTHTNTHTHTHI